MGRDTEPIGHLQPNREVAGRGGRVAFEYGKLRTRTHNGRCRPPGNGIRGECVLFVRVIVRGAGECQPRPREYSSHCNNLEEVSFHCQTSIVWYRTAGIMS